MISRKAFLKGATNAAGAIALAPLATILEACTPSAQAVRGTVENLRVIIPAAGLPALALPGGFVKVYVDELPNPFLLFRSDGEGLIAVLSTCSHRGCEVRKSKTKFECPCHGSEYDLRGNVIKGPASEPLESFPVAQTKDHLEFPIRKFQ